MSSILRTTSTAVLSGIRHQHLFLVFCILSCLSPNFRSFFNIYSTSFVHSNFVSVRSSYYRDCFPGISFNFPCLVFFLWRLVDASHYLSFGFPSKLRHPHFVLSMICWTFHLDSTAIQHVVMGHECRQFALLLSPILTNGIPFPHVS